MRPDAVMLLVLLRLFARAKTLDELGIPVAGRGAELEKKS